MKITLKVKSTEYYTRHTVSADGKQIASIADLCECPEDAIIGRDLLDGDDVIRFIKLGYEAAKKGETLEVETIEEKEE